MDQDGNLNKNEKLKLASFLMNAKIWWYQTPQNTSIDETLELIDIFEDFRREIEKE